MISRIDRIRAALAATFAHARIELIDESHKHVGHAGARDGRGHYAVRIIAADFAGRAPLARHRSVYAALGDLMQTDIHALSIEALTPDEEAS